MIQGQKTPKSFLIGLLLLIDILVNLLTFGAYGETISSRVGKRALLLDKKYLILESIINYIFSIKFIPKRMRSDRHCYESIDFEVGLTQLQLIEKMRNKLKVNYSKELYDNLHDLEYPRKV